MKKASMLATNGVFCTTAMGAILRLCLTLVFGWLVAAVGSADTLTTQPTEYSIVDSGAIGNGVTLNTKDIQAAIDLAAVKGGTVVVPQGVFLTGSIFLKPGVNLHIDQGGVLKGSANIDDYPKMPTRVEGHAVNWIPALVNADSCNGLKISGPGTLDGSGAHFWAEFENQIKRDPATTNLSVERPRLMLVQHSDNVTVSGVTFKDSGFWNLHLYDCQHALVENSHFEVPDGARCPSTDGTDIDSCQDVTVRGCVYSVDDDCVCLKGTKGPFALLDAGSLPDDHILVTGCTFNRGHGVVTLGSEATVIRDVIVENCIVNGPISLVRIKLRADTPQSYEDIHYRDITLSSSGGAIIQLEPWTQYFNPMGQPVPTSTVSNVTISDIKGSYGSFGKVVGNPGDLIAGITFNNIDVTLKHEKLTVGAPGSVTLNNVNVNGKPMTLDQALAPDSTD